MSLGLLGPFSTIAQSKDSTTVIAGKQYDRSGIHQWLWGRHYRKEWATPVKVPLLFLDTAAGGLTPYQSGGGRQSRSLHLQTDNHKQYILRSVDKSFGRAIPEIYQGTYIETILNDQVSTGHPYSALTISPMAEAGGIYHTNPYIGFVPQQKKLDSFNREYGNALYLLEQRPDENWEEAANFGNSKNIIGTEKVLEKIFKDNDNHVDQLSFVRARLFDMLIGDWGRHEDQWRWAEFEKNDQKIYEPIPRDRDQAYTKFDGFLLGMMKSVAGLGHLQSFDYKIKNANKLNYPARNLDRKFATEPSLQDWITIAKDLQSRITDGVIDSAIEKLPPEVFPISGPGIIAKLKSRRDHLPEYAAAYYKHLAREVEVVGTDKDECFEVTRLNDEETAVKVYKINKKGEREDSPDYSRVFKRSETDEIRLYGLKGKDLFHLNGDVEKGIRVRIIGGPDKDSVIDHSMVTAGKNKVEVYDDSDNLIEKSGGTKLHISNDSSIHDYKYDAYQPDKAGFRPSLFYSNEDRLYASLGYAIRKNKWRKYPFAYEHALYLHYSFMEKAFSLTYKGVYNQAFGKWSLALNGNYDVIRWTNYYGLGNESTLDTKNVTYYRMRTREYSVGAGIFRPFGKYQFLSFNVFYQNVKIIEDPERFLGTYPNSPVDVYQAKGYVGLQTDYSYSRTNDLIVPSRGIDFFSSLAYIHNLQHADSSFLNLSATFNKYFRLFPKFIFVLRGGAATLTGHPEFYQYNAIGGSQKLRGYRRTRFFGKTSVFNNNELQWINNVRSRVFNGKAGLVAFYDIGRVWMPGESSSQWHPGYGGGVLLAPFNRVSVTVAYGISRELSLFHVRLNKVIF